jgi:hypothetical protein
MFKQKPPDFLMKKNSLHDHGKTSTCFQGHSVSMLLCLSPTMKKAACLVKEWLSSITKQTTQRGSSEVIMPVTENAHPLFTNDYAPPVVSKELDSIPAPQNLFIEKTSNNNGLCVTWDKASTRQLYLLQVNVENPANPSCWITHSVSTQNWLEIEDIDVDRPLWLRVCAIGNDGRSKWALLSK